MLFYETPGGINVTVPSPHSLSPEDHVRMREVLPSVPGWRSEARRVRLVSCSLTNKTVVHYFPRVLYVNCLITHVNTMKTMLYLTFGGRPFLVLVNFCAKPVLFFSYKVM